MEKNKRKKISNFIFSILLILIIGAGTIVTLILVDKINHNRITLKGPQYVKADPTIYTVDNYSNKEYEELGYITDYKSYKELVSKYKFEEKLTEKDFKKNNYLYLEFGKYTDCTSTEPVLKNATLQDKFYLDITTTNNCGICKVGTTIYEIKIDKSITKDNLIIKKETKELECK